MIHESSALFTPKVSKLKPSDPPGYYARVLATTETVKHPAWQGLEQAIQELGEQHFGTREFATLVQSGQFRSPIRRDVAAKGWSTDVVAFINTKSGGEYKPTVVGKDALPIMDQAEIYPGCIVRVSLRPFAYGGRGSQFGAGISLGLQNIQKLKDGPRLKTARGDGSEFGRFEDEEMSALIN
jgi:Protein of unknown function (DUF2815)